MEAGMKRPLSPSRIVYQDRNDPFKDLYIYVNFPVHVIPSDPIRKLIINTYISQGVYILGSFCTG